MRMRIVDVAAGNEFVDVGSVGGQDGLIVKAVGIDFQREGVVFLAPEHSECWTW